VTADDSVLSFLNLTEVTNRDGGRYMCKASNSAGSVDHTEEIIVQGPPFVRSVTREWKEGGDLLLLCPVSGHPITRISWTRGEKALESSNKYEVSPNGQLLIRSAKKDVDCGEYICTAVGLDGQTASGTVRVVIKAAPLLGALTFPLLRAGQRAQAVCQSVQGDLPITFLWQFNGRPLHPGDQVTIHRSEFSTSLLFHPLLASHTGNYTCQATNSAGRDEVEGSLLVQAPPRWVREPKDAEVVAGEEIVDPWWSAWDKAFLSPLALD